MGDSVENTHQEYIKRNLIAEIIAKLPNEVLESYEAEHLKGLDGFMSALYNIRLKTTTEAGIKERLLIAKFMKGEEEFRSTSKSYIQFANEVYIYGTVLPEYEKVLKAANVKLTAVDWIAPVFVAKFGYIEGLSATKGAREAVLVLEHLKPQGYSNGPRLYLDRAHLLLMCRPLAQYHALSFALRLRNPAKLEQLKSGIIPLPFIVDNDPSDVKNNLYRVLYRVAFDRFFDFFDRKIDSDTFDKQNVDELKLIERLRCLREKYFSEPTRLLEHIRTAPEEREEDRRFSAILHGDYNRNNVLFQYKRTTDNAGEQAGDEKLKDVQNIKMIDFQELRYGTPAIDLSFFMYMNTPVEQRTDLWLELLKTYHGHMFETLAAILKANGSNEADVEKELEKYSFEHFNAHFKRYAFYGVMICLHFLPWMLSSEEECALLGTLFETDIHGEKFKKISIEAGGDEVNLEILSILRHACKMGYMDHLW